MSGSDVSGPDLITPLSALTPGTAAAQFAEAARSHDAALAERQRSALAACAQMFQEMQESGDTPALRDELAVWHDRIAELDRRRTDIAEDVESHLSARRHLSALLDEVAAYGGNLGLGLGRLTAAVAAVHGGSFAPADALLAEAADRLTIPAEQAARFAFGRGLIAEDDMRWTDAAREFTAAARFAPDLAILRKARAACCRIGDLTAAFRLGQGLMVLAETSGSPVARVQAMHDHALTLEAQERWAEAEGYLRKAVVAGRGLVGEAGADQAATLAALARVLERQDRLAEAEAPMRKALEVSRHSLGEAHPEFARRLLALARLLAGQGLASEAEPVLRNALDSARRAGGGVQTVGDCLSALAELAETQGQLPLAETYHRQAIAAGCTAFGPTHPDHAGRLCALAEVVRAARRLPEAEALFREAMAIDRATIGEGHRDYAVALNNLAGIVEAQGRPAEAEALYAAAIAIFRDQLGDLHPATQKVVRNFRALMANQLPGSSHRAEIEALWQAGQVVPPLAGG